MKQVLIVDDEKLFLMSVRDGLALQGESLQLHLAFNGQEAIETLQQQRIDLVVTDLKMPVMDGFQLLAYMSSHFPGIPVIVMTAFGTPQIEDRIKEFNPLHYLEKPLDLEALASAIREALNSNPRSVIRGIALATFLQLVQLEKKTCTLSIKSGSESGQLFIRQGELLDAVTQSASGIEAVYQVVCWDEPEINMDGVCLCKEKKIEGSIEHVLLEAFRRQDERDNTFTCETALAAEAAPEDWSDVQESLMSLAQKEESAEQSGAATAPAKLKVSATELTPAKFPDHLQILFRDSDLVDSYALFDAKGFILGQQPEMSRLGKMVPLLCLAAADQIGTHLGNTLDYIECSDAKGVRYLICSTPGGQLVAELKSGAGGNELIKALAVGPTAA